MKRCRNTFRKNILNDELSAMIYNYLRDAVIWEEGVRSKKGFTRKAKSLSPENTDPNIISLIDHCVSRLTNTNYLILGIYLNYYENGEVFLIRNGNKRKVNNGTRAQLICRPVKFGLKPIYPAY